MTPANRVAFWRGFWDGMAAPIMIFWPAWRKLVCSTYLERTKAP